MYNRKIKRREAARQVWIRLNLIIVIVDIGSVPVGTVVTGADGGVLIVVMLPALVVGAGVVHPVGQVSLQPLGRDGKGGAGVRGTAVRHRSKQHKHGNNPPNSRQFTFAQHADPN